MHGSIVNVVQPPTGATPLTLGNVVDGTGQIVLDDLRCTGTESRLVHGWDFSIS